MIFMSAEHVARMNEILAADAASKAECAKLDRRWEMVYELAHGAQTVWWTMSFDPASGVSFALSPPLQPADILFRGEYKAMLDWMRQLKGGGKPEGAEPVAMSGDPNGMNVIGPAFAAAQKCAALQTEIPVV